MANVKLLALVAVVLGLTETQAELDVEACGSSKSCIFFPENCNPKEGNCLFASWRKETSTDAQEVHKYTFEVSGSDGPNSYAALALGPKHEMEHAITYICTDKGLQTGLIGEEYSPPVIDENGTFGVADVKLSVDGGISTCTFTRNAVVVNGDYTSDMDNQMLYILLAGGVASIDNTLLYHGRNRVITAHSLDLTGEHRIVSNLCVSSSEESSDGEDSSSSKESQISTDKETTAAKMSVASTTGCGSTKSCVSFPTNCDPKNGQCLFASWAKDPQNPSNYVFEISGSKGANSYAALALGPKHEMEHAITYICTDKGLQTGLIGEEYSPPVIDTNGVFGVTNVEYSALDGISTCTFTRNANVVNGDYTSDMDNQMLYILLAGGITNTENFPLYHGANRVITANLLDLTDDPHVVRSLCVSTSEDSDTSEDSTIDDVDSPKGSTSSEDSPLLDDSSSKESTEMKSGKAARVQDRALKRIYCRRKRFCLRRPENKICKENSNPNQKEYVCRGKIMA